MFKGRRVFPLPSMGEDYGEGEKLFSFRYSCFRFVDDEPFIRFPGQNTVGSDHHPLFLKLLPGPSDKTFSIVSEIVGADRNA